MIFFDKQNQNLSVFMVKMINDFFNLLYPKRCLLCNNNLNAGEQLFCVDCFAHLPQTDYHLNRENPLVELFLGRADIEFASAFLFFAKQGKVQKLIHRLKYENQPEIGEYLGKIYGNILKESNIFSTVDVILPVPLHPKKLIKRGYNQSEMIAKGLSCGLCIELDVKILNRKIYTETQTKKNRFSRWQNVKDVFEIVYPEKLNNKHVLLVDDVVTTGATIEGIVTLLKSIENVNISIVCLAIPIN